MRRELAGATLSSEDRRFLLELARLAIRDALAGSDEMAVLLRAHAPTAGVREQRGAFVTLRDRGSRESNGQESLRGCIGTVATSSPLFETVPEMARAAALRDPRFSPLAVDEVERVRIEISVLGPRRRVHSPADLVIGQDGLELVLGDRRSVFLPQVAVEQRWDAERLMRQLSVKAGLGPDEWRKAELTAFGAEVFGEDDQFAGG